MQVHIHHRNRQSALLFKRVSKRRQSEWQANSRKDAENLAKADAKAREAGMSYGKYYEKLYIEQMRVKK